MTDLQIKYWGLQEEARHNMVWEQETAKNNAAQIELGWANNAVSSRMASASMIQAQAARDQANANVELINEKTRAQRLQNTVTEWSVPGLILSNYTKPASDIIDMWEDVNGILNFAKKAKDAVEGGSNVIKNYYNYYENFYK